VEVIQELRRRNDGNIIYIERVKKGEEKYVNVVWVNFPYQELYNNKVTYRGYRDYEDFAMGAELLWTETIQKEDYKGFGDCDANRSGKVQ